MGFVPCQPTSLRGFNGNGSLITNWIERNNYIRMFVADESAAQWSFDTFSLSVGSWFQAGTTDARHAAWCLPRYGASRQWQAVTFENRWNWRPWALYGLPMDLTENKLTILDLRASQQSWSHIWSVSHNRNPNHRFPEQNLQEAGW